MARTLPRRFPGALAVLACAATILLSGCGTEHPLPRYEPPLARTEFQSVRTTAYTHTEADHLEYGNRDAIGGTLRAAGIPDATTVASVASAQPVPVRLSGEDTEDAQRYGFQGQPVIRPRANVPGSPSSPYHAPGAGADSARFGASTDFPPPSAIYGSAAADWSRWPVGTVFQLASTGQVYRVSDYGFALAGRNTIDLYQSTTSAMNAWGVRRESIHVLHWGSREESLRRLRNHQKYRHIHRMVLELEGHDRAAARLE